MTDAGNPRAKNSTRIRRLVLKGIIGAVIAAALVAISAVLLGDFGTTQCKMLFVILLFVCFTLMTLFDVEVLSTAGERVGTAGVLVSAYLLLAGVVKIAVAGPPVDDNGLVGSPTFGVVVAFGQWVLLVLIARLALLYPLFVGVLKRPYRLPAVSAVAGLAVAFACVLAAQLSLPVILDRIHFADAYWRGTAIAVILTMLATVLVPLLGRFFGERVPRETRSQRTPPTASTPPRLAWPTLEDGTPLPPLDNGQPDYSVVTGGVPTA